MVIPGETYTATGSPDLGVLLAAWGPCPDAEY